MGRETSIVVSPKLYDWNIFCSLKILLNKTDNIAFLIK